MRYYLFCRKVIDPDTQDDWDDHLESIMSAYRATRHESTGMSPYFLVHHQEPPLPVDVEHRSDNNELQVRILDVQDPWVAPLILAKKRYQTT